MKRLLIVVDFQNDFVNGSLGFIGAEAIQNNILSLIKEYKDNNDDVVFTKDVHEEDYLHTEEGKNLPISHCIKGSGGECFYGQVNEESQNSLVFEKPTFGSEELFEWLKNKDYDYVGLCGLDGSICVFANAVLAKTALPNAHIVVYSSATSSGDKKALEIAYQAMRRLQIEVI